MLHIIHRFSLTGHPHCLAIILVTQTNVEMMVAFGGTVIVFYEGMFSLPKICVDYIVLRFHSDIRGTAVCGKVVPARLSLWFVASLFFFHLVRGLWCCVYCSSPLVVFLSLRYYRFVTIVLLLSLCDYRCVTIVRLLSLCDYHCVTVVTLLSVCDYRYATIVV